MSSNPTVLTPDSYVQDSKEAPHHVEIATQDVKIADLGEAQRTLVFAGEKERSKQLSTLGAIRFYWVAFLWAQYFSVGAALVGFDGTVAGAVLSIPAFRPTLGTLVDGQYVVSAAWQVGFNCAGSIFSCIGAFFFPILGDKLGRRGCLLVACVVSIGAVFLEFFVIPGKQIMWFWGKALNGIACGIFATNSSAYAVEVSPLQLRAVTTGAVNFYIVIGQFISSVVIQACGGRTDHWAFRIPISVQWAFAVFVLVILPFAPESPWILVKQGKVEQARHSLKRLFGNTGDDLELHLAVIQETIEFEATLEQHSRWADLFRQVVLVFRSRSRIMLLTWRANAFCATAYRGTDRRRTLIVMLLYICQQVTGVQFVLGYSTYFFELAGFSNSNSFKLGVGTLAIAVVGNLAGILATNAAGRRNIFLASVYACTVDCLLIGVLSLVRTQSALWAMGSFTMLYMFAFQVGLGPITYCINAEIGSARLRSKTIAWGNNCNQVFGLIINIINPYMINPDEANLQGKVGWLFGGMSLFASIAAWYWIPETGGRTVDELDLMFKKKVPSRKFKDYEITHEDRLQMEQLDSSSP